ncbi:hypothetical protein BDN70DRAFT_893317 [Pholiota conissans]|uniref:F-box domain-containing protein n=1 Tax=Pholiota conissans TaxID=109636 RepID=A0A9P5Z5H9_9AGAR|nr:hypothetical protein BDN70DRAFT_893317 [Pholiota conissans]
MSDNILMGNGPISMDGSTSLEDSHRLINEAIVQYQESIVALKSQKNRLALISRLPPEILCQIFLFTKLAGGNCPPARYGFFLQATGNGPKNPSRYPLRLPPYIKGQYDRPYSLNWIRVTRVSSYWRRLAIDSPKLWVNLPMENFQWTKEMLQRSKDNASLVVDIESLYGNSPVYRAFELVLTHHSCIKRLSIHNVHHSSNWNDIRQKFPQSAPQLEYLCLKMCIPHSDENAALWYDPVIISNQLFKTGRLRHLDLLMFQPDWNLHPSAYRSLTYLKLHDLWPISRPTGKQFMDALKAMPDLQYMDLRNAFPTERLPWSSDYVHLPDVRTLVLNSKFTEVNDFLHCVTFPPTASVKICCTVQEHSSSRESLSGVIFGLRRSYSAIPWELSSHSLIFESRLQDIHYPYGICLKLFESTSMEEYNLYSYRDPPALQLEIFIAWDREPSYIQDFVVEGLFGTGGLFFQQVIKVYLKIDLPIHPQTIANSLGKLPRIRHIFAERHSTRLLVEALNYGSHARKIGHDGLAEKLYFPSLSVLDFHGIQFWNPELTEVMQDPKSISFDILRDFLVQRFQSGAKIEKLSLLHCEELQSTHVDSIAHVVSSVEWDSISVHRVIHDDDGNGDSDASNDDEDMRDSEYEDDSDYI